MTISKTSDGTAASKIHEETKLSKPGDAPSVGSNGSGKIILRPEGSRWEAFSIERIGAVYVWIASIILFSLLAPSIFPQIDTVQQILNSSAIMGLAALAIITPLAAGVFDLSFAYTMSLTGVITATVVAKTDLGLVAGILIAMAIALVIGLLNTLLVVNLQISSFIATMASGLIVQSIISFMTGGTNVNDAKLNEGFTAIGQTHFFGITLPVIYLLIVALIMWIFFEHTAIGRRMFATGYNEGAARLAGVPTAKLRFIALMTSSAIAGFAGIVLASSISTGSPTAGTPYLLSAFAAAFLGATQFKRGRFNVWGTIVAVLLLSTGVTGLSLAGAGAWAGSLFTGIVLIVALAVTTIQKRQRGS